MSYRSDAGRRGVDRAPSDHAVIMRPIRVVNAWNVFVEGDGDDMTVVYRLRWLPTIGGAIKIADDVAKDWRHLPLEKFSKKYFRLRIADRPSDRTSRAS